MLRASPRSTVPLSHPDASAEHANLRIPARVEAKGLSRSYSAVRPSLRVRDIPGAVTLRRDSRLGALVAAHRDGVPVGPQWPLDPSPCSRVYARDIRASHWASARRQIAPVGMTAWVVAGRGGHPARLT